MPESPDNPGVDNPRLELITNTDKFTRDTTLFGTIIAAFVAWKYFRSRLRFFAFVAFDISVFYAIENQVKKVTDSILYDSKYAGAKKVSGKMFVYSFQAFNLSLITFIASLNQEVSDMHDLIVENLLMTTSLFSLAAAIQAAVLATGAISQTMIRRGFFGVYLGMFLIMHTVVVSLACVSYLWTKERFRWFALAVYGAVKVALVWYMVTELKESFNAFKKNKNRMFRNAPGERVYCGMCRGLAVEPKVLGCRHMFCYRCCCEWFFARKNICPVCRQDTIGPIPLRVDLANGYVPLIVFVCVI